MSLSMPVPPPALANSPRIAQPARFMDPQPNPFVASKAVGISFDGALQRIAAAHGAEVDVLQEENQTLKRYIAKLECSLKSQDVDGKIGKRTTFEDEVKTGKRPTFEDAEGKIGKRTTFEDVEEKTGKRTTFENASPAEQGATEKAKLAFKQSSSKTMKMRRRSRAARQSVAGRALGDAGDPDSGGDLRRTDSVFRHLFTCKTALELADGTNSEIAALKPTKFFTRVFARHKEKADQTKKAVKKMTRMSARDARSYLDKALQHPSFNAVCAGVIIVNSILIGAAVEIQARSADHEENDLIMLVLELCTVFFFVELVLRVIAQGPVTFFWTDTWNRGWNCFDAGLVWISACEKLFQLVYSEQSEYSAMGSIIKTMKMLRVVRLFRVFRFFRELSDLALMVIDAGRSLVWAIVMLAIIIFVFACCFTSTAIGKLGQIEDEGSHNAQSESIKKLFGTLAQSTYTLVQTTLGGVSWREVSDMVLELDSFSMVLFFVYLLFTMLAVLNIITGVFVENAVELARTQRDFMMQKEREVKEKYISDLQELFSQMDEDCSGTVSIDEIWSYFDDPGVQSYFQALGLDVDDAARLFDLIDDDGSGDVSLTEFIEGCLRLKGLARSIDMFHLIVVCTRIEGKLQELVSQHKQGTMEVCKEVYLPPSSELQKGGSLKM